MTPFMEEQRSVNQFALHQLEDYYDFDSEEDDDYVEHTMSPSKENKQGDLVNEVTKRIAELAFKSSKTSAVDEETSFTESIKNICTKPAVKEAALIISIMALKVGLLFTFKKAIKIGITEVINL